MIHVFRSVQSYRRNSAGCCVAQTVVLAKIETVDLVSFSLFVGKIWVKFLSYCT